MTVRPDLRLPDECSADLLRLTGGNLTGAVRTVTELTRATTAAWFGLAHRTGPVDLAARGLIWWSEMYHRRRPSWQLPNTITLSTPIAHLRDFTAPLDTTRDVVPTLVLPPQAGHSSVVVDFSPTQSQLEVIRSAGLVRLCTSRATAGSRTGSNTPRTSPAPSTCGWSSTCSGATS